MSAAAAQFSKTRLSLGTFFLGHIKMMINIHNQFLLPFVSIIRDLLASFFSVFFKSNITEFINVR